MFRPLQFRGSAPTAAKNTTMAPKGVNLDTYLQLLNLDYALNIDNYIPTSSGYLKKRKGLSRQLNIGGTSPITMIKQYTDSVILYAYSTNLVALNTSTLATTNIKTNFTADTFDGRRYGDYFFLTSKINGLWRVSQTLAYDGQSGNFAAGLKLTGATSGATAVVLEDSDGGATGTLTLGTLSGTFQNDELITDSATGSATVNGTLTYAITSISTAPKAGTMEIIGNRLFLGDLVSDPGAVAYSIADVGVNPAFGTNWTVSAVYTDPGQLNYRNGGQVKAIRGMGGLNIVLQDKGKFAFSIDTFDSNGTIKKTDNTQLFREDFGGSRAAVVTDQGMFYANEAGLWQLSSVGQTNIPFSNQESKTSTFLGKTYFDNINLDSADMAYDAKNRIIILTCAKGSTNNNFVIIYNIDSGAFSFASGLNLNRLLNIDQTIWAVDSDTARIYKLFDGYSDDGADISCDYEQEISLGTFYAKNLLKGCYIQGFLSTTSSIQVRFDIYDETGTPVSNKARFTWTPQRAASPTDGFGAALYGSSSWGGDSDLEGLIESFDGCRPFVRSFQRIRLHITSQGQDIHSINWVSLLCAIGTPIKIRKMARIS